MQPSTQILLIGHGSRDAAATAEYNQFADKLAGRLRLPVQPCFLEFADPPIVDGLRACAEAGARRIIALPLFLGPAGHQKNDVPTIINWAKTEWPQLDIKYGTPLGAQPQIIDALAARAAEAIAASPTEIPAADTALIVVGRGSRDPDSNSDVSKISRMLWEGRDFGAVETAFYALTDPGIEAVIERAVKLGARRIVTLPYLLFTGRIRQRLDERVVALRQKYPQVDILTAEHLGAHAGVIEAALYRTQQVLDGSAAMTCDLCKYRHQFAGFEAEFGLPQSSDHAHGLRGVPHGHGPGGANYEQAIEALLPARYQGGNSPSAAPMSAADLKFDADGQVAWDEIWEGFCDLALAGGPSHRGELLEPVSPEAAAANPAAYETVLAEIERGIRQVSGLPVVRSQAPGWVGVQCTSEEMALWLLRAIVVENVTVRREGAVLYLPAGPDFRLKYEIKNVVTVIAKTSHYWTEHIAAGSATAPAANGRNRQ
jgi:sirohydrochlorin cobaltochelatase